MIVDDSFSRLTTGMIVQDSFSVSSFGNHWPDSSQKTCCRPLSSRKIHTFTSLSSGTPFSISIFTRKEIGTRCARDFACTTAGELSLTITNFFGRLTIWTIVDDSWGRINYHRLSRAVWHVVTSRDANWIWPDLATGNPSSLVTVNMTLRNGVIIRVCLGNTSILRNSSK